MPELKIIADLRESEQSRIAVLEDGKLAEIFIEYNDENSKLSRQGDIFKARVDKIMPSINAAFVAISSKSDKNELRNAFLYLGESVHTSSLKAGQNIIVQIIKNARKNKAPRVSARISVPGRWIVLVPDSDETGVSRRIEDNSERNNSSLIPSAAVLIMIPKSASSLCNVSAIFFRRLRSALSSMRLDTPVSSLSGTSTNQRPGSEILALTLGALFLRAFFMI